MQLVKCHRTYFHCINTVVRVLCNGCSFSLSCGSRRLFGAGLIVISVTAISSIIWSSTGWSILELLQCSVLCYIVCIGVSRFQILVYFLSKNWNPPLKKVTLLFPSNPPLKIEVLSSPPFWKLVWRFLYT